MNSVVHVPGAAGRSFSDAISTKAVAGRWVFVSGKLGVEAPRSESLSFEAEVRSCFAAVKNSLEKCDAAMADVVRVDVFLTDLSQYMIFSKVRGEVFSVNPPTSTAVQVAGLLLNARIEITAVAFLPA